VASNQTELIDELRLFTGYGTGVLDDTEFGTVIDRAAQHVSIVKDISDESFDFYASQDREEALFWFSCLFAKVAVKELDAQTIQVGSIDLRSLLAKDHNDATTWFRNAQAALRALDSNGDAAFGVGIGSVTRKDRVYGKNATASTNNPLGG